MHELLTERDTKSEFVLAAQILESQDEAKCIQYLRMNKAQFSKLLALVEPDIRKQDTYWREAISARNRLILTLRYSRTKIPVYVFILSQYCFQVLSYRRIPSTSSFLVSTWTLDCWLSFEGYPWSDLEETSSCCHATSHGTNLA